MLPEEYNDSQRADRNCVFPESNEKKAGAYHTMHRLILCLERYLLFNGFIHRKIESEIADGIPVGNVLHNFF